MSKNYLTVDGYDTEPFTYRLSRNPEIWFKFHPPAALDELLRGKLFEPKYINGRWITPHVDWFEIAVTELSLLFSETNYKDKETGIPDDDLSTHDARLFLELLPSAVVEEIWYGIYDRFKGWGPKYPNSEEANVA
jgi:hypothetical protein